LSIILLSFKILKKKIVFIGLVFVTIVLSLGFWYPPLGYEKINESYWWNYPLTTTYFGETDLIWSEGPAKSYPKQRVEIINGKGNITNFSKKTTIQTFSINAQKESRLVSYTQYFPGWKVFVNNKEVPVQFQDQNWRGLITFIVPKGKSFVRIVFGENKLRLFADYVSLITLSMLILIFILK